MADNDTQMNMGTRTREIVRPPKFPDAGAAVREHIVRRERPNTAVDVLLVNPQPASRWSQVARKHDLAPGVAGAACRTALPGLLGPNRRCNRGASDVASVRDAAARGDSEILPDAGHRADAPERHVWCVPREGA